MPLICANSTDALGHEIIPPVSLPVPLPEGFSLIVVGRMLLLKTEVPLQLVGGGRVTCGQNSELQCRVPNLWRDLLCVFRLLLFLALHSLVAVSIDAHLIGDLRKSSLSVYKMLGYCGVECFSKVEWEMKMILLAMTSKWGSLLSDPLSWVFCSMVKLIQSGSQSLPCLRQLGTLRFSPFFTYRGAVCLFPLLFNT